MNLISNQMQGATIRNFFTINLHNLMFTNKIRLEQLINFLYLHINIYIYSLVLTSICGPGSSVGIATDYGLEGPGSNPGEDEIFRPSRPALGPTQPPVKWVPGLSPGVKCGRDVLLTIHPLLVPRSWKSRAITLPTLWATPGL